MAGLSVGWANPWQSNGTERTVDDRAAVGTAPLVATTRVTLSEVLSSLSYALDLTEGHPAGHTLGSAVIGMRIADALQLDPAEKSALYYALLLKDAGCSSNAARIAALFGSADQFVKHRMKFVDWHRRVPLALHTARIVGQGRGPQARVRHFLRIARTQDMTRDLIQTRCERGADIVGQLGFPAETVEAIRCLDEHWCGSGYPLGKREADIPLLARIANISQSVQLFNGAYGRDAALRMARSRRGTWFDPQLVDMLHSWRDDHTWWARLRDSDVLQSVVAAEPGHQAQVLDNKGLDAIARAFAQIIDAKSPFTFRHSANVARYARAMADHIRMPADEQQRIYRAGLLHDIGKLGVSNSILDKNGQLTAEERLAVERHPVYSWEILSRVPAFAGFARLAAVHHEKLDGSGYPWGLQAADLDLPERILAVADIYEAMTAERPYRAGMLPAKALELIKRDAGPKLCAGVVGELETCVTTGHLADALRDD